MKTFRTPQPHLSPSLSPCLPTDLVLLSCSLARLGSSDTTEASISFSIDDRPGNSTCTTPAVPTTLVQPPPPPSSVMHIHLKLQPSSRPPPGVLPDSSATPWCRKPTDCLGHPPYLDVEEVELVGGCEERPCGRDDGRPALAPLPRHVGADDGRLDELAAVRQLDGRALHAAR